MKRFKKIIALILTIILLSVNIPSQNVFAGYGQTLDPVSATMYTPQSPSSPVTSAKSGETVSFVTNFPSGISGKSIVSTFISLVPKGLYQPPYSTENPFTPDFIYPLRVTDTPDFHFTVSSTNVLRDISLMYSEWVGMEEIFNPVPAGEYNVIFDLYADAGETEEYYAYISANTLEITAGSGNDVSVSLANANLSGVNFLKSATNVSYTLSINPATDIPMAAGTVMPLSAFGIDFSNAVATNSGISLVNRQSGSVGIRFDNETIITASGGLSIGINGVINPDTAGTVYPQIISFISDKGTTRYIVAGKTLPPLTYTDSSHVINVKFDEARLTGSNNFERSTGVTYTLFLKPDVDFVASAGTKFKLYQYGINFEDVVVTTPGVSISSNSYGYTELRFDSQTSVSSTSGITITFSGVGNPSYSGDYSVSTGAFTSTITNADTSITEYRMSKKELTPLSIVSKTLQVNVPEITLPPTTYSWFMLKLTHNLPIGTVVWSGNALPTSPVNITFPDYAVCSKIQLFGQTRNGDIELASYTGAFGIHSGSLNLTETNLCKTVNSVTVNDSAGGAVPNEIYEMSIYDSNKNKISLPGIIPYGNYTVRLSPKPYVDEIYLYDFNEYTGQFTVDSNTPKDIIPWEKVFKFVRDANLHGKISFSGASQVFAGARVNIEQCINGKSFNTTVFADQNGNYSADVFTGFEARVDVSYQNYYMDKRNLIIPAQQLITGSLEKNFEFSGNPLTNSIVIKYAGTASDSVTKRYLDAMVNVDLKITAKTDTVFRSEYIDYYIPFNETQSAVFYLTNSADKPLIDALMAKPEGQRNITLQYNGSHIISGSQQVSMNDDGTGYTEINIVPKGGVIIDAVVDTPDSIYALWFDANGNLVSQSNVCYLVYNTQTIAFSADGGTYTLVLIPRDLVWQKMPRNISDIEDIESKVVKENITVENGKGIDLGKIVIPVSPYKFPLIPNSNAVAPGSYKTVSELITVTGHMELNRLFKQGKVSQIDIDVNPYGGLIEQTANIQYVVINGKSYTPTLSFGVYHINFDSPMELPLNYTIYAKPQRLERDMELKITAIGTFQHGDLVNRLSHTASYVLIKKPSLSVTAPALTESETVMLSGTGTPGETVTITDNGITIGTAKVGAYGSWRAEATLYGTQLYSPTNHNIQAISEAGEKSNIVKTRHQKGGAELQEYYMYFGGMGDRLGDQIMAGGGYTWYTNPGNTETYNIAFGATFKNADLIRPNYDFGDGSHDVFSSGVVFMITTLNGQTSYYEGIRNGNSYTTPNILFTNPVSAMNVLYTSLTPAVPVTVENIGDTMPGRGANTIYTDYKTVKPVIDELNKACGDALLDSDSDAAISEFTNYNGSLGNDTAVSTEQGNGDTTGFFTTQQYISDLPDPGQGKSSFNMLNRLISKQQIDTMIGDSAGYERNIIMDDSTVKYVILGKSVSTPTVQGRIGYILDYSGSLKNLLTDDISYDLITNNGVEPICVETSFFTKTSQPAVQLMSTMATPIATLSTPMATFSAPKLMMAASPMAATSSSNGGFVYSNSSIVSSTADGFGTYITGMQEFNSSGAGNGLMRNFSKIGKTAGVVGLATTTYATIDTNSKMQDMKFKLQFMKSKCFNKAMAYYGPNVKANFENNFNNFEKMLDSALTWNNVTGGVGIFSGSVGLALTKTPSGVGTAIGGLSMLANFGFNSVNDQKQANIDGEFDLLQGEVNRIIKKYADAADDPDCKPKPTSSPQPTPTPGPPTPPQPPTPPTPPTPPDPGKPFIPKIDPSGYVYEAVASNRIEDANVTLYKEVDGDIAEVLPYSDDIDDNNPLISNDIGKYQWFVPEGKWFVTAQKAGYESNNSNNDPAATVNLGDRNWLPVMPPQLDVNIGLTSYESPNVDAKAYSTSAGTEIYLTFSKYMTVSSAKESGSIVVLLDGIATDKYTLEGVNTETSPNHTPHCGNQELASVFVIKINEDITGKNLSVKVYGGAKSYSGISSNIFDSGSLSITPKQSAGTLTAAITDGAVKPNTAVILDQTNEYGFIPLNLSGIVAGADVYYTTDGSLPSRTNGVLLPPGGVIKITEDVTIKLVAVKTGYIDGNPLVLNYTIDNNSTGINPVSKPVITISGKLPDGKINTEYSTYITSDNWPTAYAVTAGALPNGLNILPTGEITGIPTKAGVYDFTLTASNSAGTSNGQNFNITIIGDGSSPSSGGGGGGTTHYKITLQYTDLDGNIVKTDIKQLSRGFVIRTENLDIPEGYRLVENNFSHTVQKDEVLVITIEAIAPPPVKEKPFISGYPDGLFKPDSSISRGELAQILYNMLSDGSQIDTANLEKFNDVDLPHWAVNPLSWAIDKGYLKGYDSGILRPDKPITRAELAAVLNRVSKSEQLFGEEDSENPKFVDFEKHWAYEDIITMANKGIIKGYPDSTFRPDNDVTRAEAVTMISRLFSRSNEFAEGKSFADVLDTHWAYIQIMNAVNGNVQ